MLRNRSEIEAALAGAGWSLVHCTDEILTVEGRLCDASYAISVRDRLRSFVTVQRNSEDGDVADEIFAGFAKSGSVARRFGTTKLRVKVVDGERACEELEHLGPTIRENANFEEAMATVERRGWQVDRGNSHCATYDSYVLDIRARRDDEHFELGFMIPGNQGDGAIHIDVYGNAVSVTPSASVRIEIRSCRLAEDLLDALARAGGAR